MTESPNGDGERRPNRLLVGVGLLGWLFAVGLFLIFGAASLADHSPHDRLTGVSALLFGLLLVWPAILLVPGESERVATRLRWLVPTTAWTACALVLSLTAHFAYDLLVATDVDSSRLPSGWLGILLLVLLLLVTGATFGVALAVTLSSRRGSEPGQS